jgi:HK97 family phage major capsid protein
VSEQQTRTLDVNELRTEGRTLYGLAAPYNSPSKDLGGFTEIIASGAFTDVLRADPDVHLVLNHDVKQVLARTKSGTLRLEETERGLEFNADLPDSPLGQNVRESIRRGDIDGASFRFTIGAESWEGDQRTVTMASSLTDVTVATRGAYQAAHVELRSDNPDPAQAEEETMSQEAQPATEPAEDSNTETEERSEDRAQASTHGGLAVEDRTARPEIHTIPATGEVRTQALHANERADFLAPEARDHMERTLRQDDDPDARLAQFTVATSSRDYFRAFSKVMNDPVSGGHEWTPEERGAVQRVRHLQRSLNLSTSGTAGGFLVPYELDPSIIISSAGAVSPLRQISRVVTTAQNEKRFVTSLGVTSTWTPEEQQQTDDSPTLLQPAVVCKKGAAFVPVSYELYEDSDIAQQIGAVFADAKAVREASALTITESNGPTGIITALVAAGGSTVIATATNVLAQADLYNNQAALPARWRPNAKWMMNLSIINGYRQLPQATGLNYSIVNDSTSPPTALGWPIYENSTMDSTLTGSAADYLVLSGDFQQFAIVDRVGTTIELVPQLFGAAGRPTGQRGFYLHWRVGSGVLVADAFRLSNFSA